MMTTVRPTSQRRPDAPGDLETVPARATLARALPHDLSLLVVSGPDRGRSLRMALGRHVVGKAPDCALVLSDPLVSRHHLEVEVSTEQLRFRDLGSRNGCFFEGARFDNLVVGVGAQVLLGETELKVAFTDDAAAHLPESRQDHFGELLGESPAMRRVFTLLERVAKGDSAVLLQGETGTGKDLAAEAIHAASARAAGPFVICDLAGVPRTLLESELFGHVRGSFTSAERDREGAFAQAHGGTLFLDEIGELDAEAQPRLLRVLERRQVKAVGGGVYRTVDVRVIAATNRDLLAEVRAGRFRRDLYHRLAVVRVELPPLRERRQDIPLLAAHFLKLSATAAGRKPLAIPPAAMTALCAHDWPGNARELRNVLDHAQSLCEGQEAIDPHLLGLDGAPADRRATSTDSSLPFKESRERLVEAWERDYLRDLLGKAGHNVSQAARWAGISRVYLHELIKKHGMER
jgi:DNA-binding NtrC family response regulator